MRFPFILREYRIEKKHSGKYQIVAKPGNIPQRLLRRSRNTMRYDTEVEAWEAMKRMANKYKHWAYHSYPEYDYPSRIIIWGRGYK